MLYNSINTAITSSFGDLSESAFWGRERHKKLCGKYAQLIYSNSRMSYTLVGMGRAKQFDVARMRRDFLSSNVTLRTLAKKHGCSYRYISGLSSQEKWYPQRRELKAQQESAVTEALVERVAQRSAELAELKVATAQEHVARSLQTGERLHALLLEGLTAVEKGDARQIKTVIEAWAVWDKQMRQGYQIEDKQQERPLVDINVMAALPTRAQMEERAAVEVTVA